MRLDFVAQPELAKRFRVIDRENSEIIKDVAWADDATGEYACFRRRPKTMSDSKDADLLLRDGDGNCILRIAKADLFIQDLAKNPFKDDVLELLRDPEVQEALRGALHGNA